MATSIRTRPLAPTSPATSSAASAAAPPPSTPSPRPASSPDAGGSGGPRRAHKAIVGDVATADRRAPSVIDARVGKTLQRALGGVSLQSAAANPKHARKMEESATIIAAVEKLPGRLASVTAFKPSDVFALYEHCFPNPDEREPIADIKARIKDYDGAQAPDGGGFHAHAYADADGHAIAYSQGSTVPSKDGAGLFYYWQYGCVADQAYMKDAYGKDTNPREHGILNTMHGVQAATLQATAAATGKKPVGMLWESEPRGLGDDAASIQFTDKRLQIHNNAGGRVMMGVSKDGALVNLHLQPRLSADSEPIALHMMFRPLAYAEGDEKTKSAMVKEDAEAMLLGWVDNFRREGFAEVDVAEAEAEIRARLADSVEIVLLPPSALPDAVTLAAGDPLLAKQLLDMYGVADLDAARAFYDRAMATSRTGSPAR